MSTVLFDISLDHIIKKLETTGTVGSKMTQSMLAQSMARSKKKQWKNY